MLPGPSQRSGKGRDPATSSGRPHKVYNESYVDGSIDYLTTSALSGSSYGDGGRTGTSSSGDHSYHVLDPNSCDVEIHPPPSVSVTNPSDVTMETDDSVAAAPPYPPRRPIREAENPIYRDRSPNRPPGLPYPTRHPYSTPNT